MRTVLITKFKNQTDAKRAAKILKEQGISFESRVDDIEDLYLAKLIDEGMKETVRWITMNLWPNSKKKPLRLEGNN